MLVFYSEFFPLTCSWPDVFLLSRFEKLIQNVEKIQLLITIEYFSLRTSKWVIIKKLGELQKSKYAAAH